MENKVKELGEMGYNIQGIIDGTSNKRVLDQFFRLHKHQDIVIPKWTEESITRFSNKVYEIVTKHKERQVEKPEE